MVMQSAVRNTMSGLEGVQTPAMSFTQIFDVQSYFSTSLSEKAILEQPPSAAIIPSTEQAAQVAGYAVAVHPASETPLAVIFDGGNAGTGQSGTFYLKPGEILRPSGSKFNGVKWGLPLGWLGGGLAHLVVFTTPVAEVFWGDHNELLFHRIRVPIYQPGSVPSNTAAFNWPTVFPWISAKRGSSSILQGGQGIISVTGTKVLAVLRGLASLASAASMRVIFQRSEEFGLDSSTGLYTSTNSPFEDIIWPAWTAIAVGGNLSTQNPLLTILPGSYGGMLTRLTGSQGGIALVDGSGSGALTECYVDFCRYGKL